MKQGIIFILISVLMFIGCQKDTQTNASIVGDWQRNIVVDNGYSIPVELSFNEDGTAGAMIGDSDDGNEIFGTYSINEAKAYMKRAGVAVRPVEGGQEKWARSLIS